MNRSCALVVGLLFVVAGARANAFDLPFFGSGNPIAPRDEWGQLHQMPEPDETDFAHHEPWRLFYYAKSRHDLAKDPAYIGSLQVTLQRLGYYCGPIDGIMSPDVTDAIARMQKAYRMHVTGNLTIAVRRALRMP